jgi:TonB-linked SusC/RagA family outer membrane protein
VKNQFIGPIKNTSIMLKNKQLMLVAFLLLLTNILQAQTRTITGKVTSAANEAQPGASVIIKETLKGTVADANGRFTITAPSSEVTLVVSSIGFDKMERKIGPATSEANFVLAESTGNLSEVVVTALGISREKKTLVYATQTVKPAELVEARDPNNIINSLSGKIANAVITQGSGGPGSGARIVLRGNRSIQGSNNALIVVDGVPLSNGTNGTAGSDFGFVQGSDGASSINPDDIESVTVLRGASAAALYGSQAGNGVLVITTKKGKADRIAVSLNSGFSTENVWALPRFQNSYGQGNGGKLSTTSGESWGEKMTGQSITDHLGQPGSYSPQPNNVKDFFRQGGSLNNSVSVTGGTDKMQTYLSYTNNRIMGIIDKNNLARNTINLRISNQISKRFSTDAKITYLTQQIDMRPRSGEENSPVSDIYNVARNMTTAQLSQFQKINNVGIPEATNFPSTLSSIYQNPYWMTNNYINNEARNRVIGFLTAKFKLTDWLTLSGKANLDKTTDQGETSIYQGTILYGKGGGEYSKSTINATEKWFDAMLEGNNNITGNLKINYRVGGIFQDGQWDGNFQSAGGLNVTNKFSLNFAQSPSVSSGFTEVQTQSAFGQANLSLKDMVFLDLSLRNDWDSRLPAPHSFLYPSVGASAILSDLMKISDKISFLKANINYAEVGNGGRFGLLKSVYNYGQGAGNGFLQISSTLPFPGLKPEIVKNLEFGLEARFLQNRLGFNATYYKSNSFNQLLSVSLPVATGFSSKYINAGNIQNSGFEFVLNGTPLARESALKWDITLNAAMNKNKVVELSPEVKIFYLGGGFGRSATPVVEEGKSYGDLWAFKWATNAAGNYIVEANGKPKLTQEQSYIGNFNPKATLGLSNSFSYKAISARILIDGRVGGTLVSGTEMNLAFSGITEATEANREGNWNLGGVDATGQKVSTAIKSQDFWQIASGKRYGAGEFFAYDATSFRVRELSLGYSIPLKSIKAIKAAKLMLVGRNLMWLYRGSSKMDIPGLGKRKMWFDPDMSLGNGNFQGVEYGTMPATRTMGVNLQVTF